MAHGSVPLAGTPQKLDLAEGAPHWVQNLGDGPMYVQAVTGNTAPTDLDAARFVIPPKGSLVLTAHAGESTFAWGHHGGLVGHSQTPGAGALIASAFYDHDWPISRKRDRRGNRFIGERNTPFSIGDRNYFLTINADSSSSTAVSVSVIGDASGDGTIWMVVLSGTTERARGSFTNRGSYYLSVTPAFRVGDTLTLQLWASEPPSA